MSIQEPNKTIEQVVNLLREQKFHLERYPTISSYSKNKTSYIFGHKNRFY